MNLDAEYRKALAEVGEINPWWSDEDEMYVFSHPAYPAVDYLDPDPERVIRRYQEVMKEFIRNRMAGNLADVVERITPGRGGARPGSGRPRNEIATVTIRIPEDIASWLKANPEKHFAAIRKLMA